MVKGAQKQMIVVKTADSDLFEEAYFVLRRNTSAERMDMVEEANKIIENCGIKGKRSFKPDAKLLMFTFGSFVGGGAIGAIAVGLAAFFA